MRVRPLIGAQPVQSGQLDNAAGLITYWVWRETTGGASATIELYDGSSVGGLLLATIQLNPAESTRDYLGVHAVPYRTGLYLSLVAGVAKGQVYSVLDGDWDVGMPVVVIGEVDVNLSGVESL